MSWLDRVRHAPLQHSKVNEVDGPRTDEPVERSAPGLAALFEPLTEDGHHSVLDLGPGGDWHLRLYGRFASQIRFAGLLPHLPRDGTSATAQDALPPNTHRPYDVVLAWDILDRVDPSERAALIARVADLTAPGARLYVVVDSSGATTRRPTRSTLIDLDRVLQQAVGPPEPARDPLLPAHVERILAPFQVAHAYTLRTGLREYVAVKH